MSHEIKGCLVKFNQAWSDGTVILPEAFKDDDGCTVPVASSFKNKWNKPVGTAKLYLQDEAMYYIATLDDTDEVKDLIEKVKTCNFRLALFANQIKKEGKEVSYGRIRMIAFAYKCDNVAEVYEIDQQPLRIDITPEFTSEKIMADISKKDKDAYESYFKYEPDNFIGIVKYYYFGRLNWCGCGKPGDALRTVQKFLKASSEKDIEKREKALEEAFGVKHIYDNDLLCCLAYSLDAAGLTEHGSSIYWAWLTQDGEYFLWAIDEAVKRDMIDI